MKLIERQYRIRGLVQGVGFRPFVAEQAKALNVSGEVLNSGGSVSLRAAGEEKAVDELIRRLFLSEAQVESVDLLSECLLSALPETRFRIVPSESVQDGVRVLPPDIATCEQCERELFDENNRRFRHPFISCTSCGPRFTIMKQVPYDREHTTMGEFSLCPSCGREYQTPGDRRRYAQTICCPDCGPQVKAVDFSNDVPGDKAGGGSQNGFPANPQMVHGENAITTAINAISNGKIAAIKDIGGYHFAFLATDSAAAVRLRAFKHRDGKPFAVMFNSVDEVREAAKVSKTEEQLLLSPERPIVLLKRKSEAMIAPEICADSDRIGAMLPCNPLQMLIGRETGPIVMTSGNRGGEPIITNDDTMLKLAKKYGVPDVVLCHNREIWQGLDDSICQVVKTSSREIVQILRRARGYVPKPIFLRNGTLKEDAFAAGGDLKSVFAFGREDAITLSGHFGDLEDARAQEERERAISHLGELLAIYPERFVKDRHPQYISGALPQCLKTLPEERQTAVQHHHAHALSVMAEHGLSEALGVVYDGTGYGVEENVWGGEFLLCKGREYKRVGHLLPVEMPGGDVSAKCCDAVAYAYLLSVDEVAAERFAAVRGKEKQFALWKSAIQHHLKTVSSSSMGRLFDAAAAVLGIAHENAYEGQAPMLLQRVAERYEEAMNSRRNTDITEDFNITITKMANGAWTADARKLIKTLFEKREAGEDKNYLAWAFHQAVAHMTIEMCVTIQAGIEKTRPLALSGGTMQNALLLRLLVEGLECEHFTVYTNEQVPPGDGGLALGQIYYLAGE